MSSTGARSYGNPHLAVLGAIRERYGDDLILTFSRYQVGPPGQQEQQPRRFIRVPISEVNEAWVSKELVSLRATEELAMHSRVVQAGGIRQICMIDYEGDGSLGSVVEIGRELFGSAIQRMRVRSAVSTFTFATGRSFHQYSDLLLPMPAWYRLLGTMLLLDPGAGATVDARWIGHALRKGYAALRWTSNTDRYLQEPTLVLHAGSHSDKTIALNRDS